MGYLKEETGFTMLGKVPEGACETCAMNHEPHQPHNQQSMAYQYKFYDENGRWPTWEDAMAHCSDETKIIWTNALEKQGVDFGGKEDDK